MRSVRQVLHDFDLIDGVRLSVERDHLLECSNASEEKRRTCRQVTPVAAHSTSPLSHASLFREHNPVATVTLAAPSEKEQR